MDKGVGFKRQKVESDESGMVLYENLLFFILRMHCRECNYLLLALMHAALRDIVINLRNGNGIFCRRIFSTVLQGFSIRFLFFTVLKHFIMISVRLVCV